MEFGFFLKKFVSFFAEPLGLVLVAFALGLIFLLQKRVGLAKGFVAFGVFLLLLFSYPPFASWLIAPLESHYTKFTPLNSHHNIKYIHVLGSGHSIDTDQSITSQLSNTAIKRVTEGVMLHKALPHTKLIFTGYAGDTNTSNAQMNAMLALALGVKKESIIINEAPKDTQEEAAFSASIINAKPFILVTSASHMYRSMRLFQEAGLDPIAAPTDFHKEQFSGYLRAPRAYYFYISSVALHEYLGVLWSYIRS